MADTGTASITISATPQRIMEVVADVEAMPDRLDAFKNVKVLDRDDQGRPLRAEFELDARIKVVEYTLEYDWQPDRVEWHNTSGNVKEIKGSYSLAADGDSTTVTYEYSIDAGFPVPSFLRKQGVKIMVSTALDDLKKTAEKN